MRNDFENILYIILYSIYPLYPYFIIFTPQSAGVLDYIPSERFKYST